MVWAYKSCLPASAKARLTGNPSSSTRRVIFLPFIFPALEIRSPFFCTFHRAVQVVNSPLGELSSEAFKQSFQCALFYPESETVIHRHFRRKTLYTNILTKTYRMDSNESQKPNSHPWRLTRHSPLQAQPHPRGWTRWFSHRSEPHPEWPTAFERL